MRHGIKGVGVTETQPCRHRNRTETPKRKAHLCGQLLFIKLLETSIDDISQEKSREKTGETQCHSTEAGRVLPPCVSEASKWRKCKMRAILEENVHRGFIKWFLLMVFWI